MISEQNAYRLINLILAGIIVLVFIYSAIFSFEKENHLIHSFHTIITGKKALSTGLSRSFSAIVRLEFDIAQKFNPYGISVFLFFLEQLILRLVFFVFATASIFSLKQETTFDLILSSILFVFHFKPFILAIMQ